MTGFEDRGPEGLREPPGADGAALTEPESRAPLPAARLAAPPLRRRGPAAPLRDAYESLAGLVAEALRAPEGFGPVRVTVPVPVPGLDPLDWLAAQSPGPALYWRDREGRRRVAGSGFADRLALGQPDAMGDLLAQAARRLRDAPPDLRYYGGLRFDLNGHRAAEWRDFGLGWLAMPRFEAAETDGAASLACTVFPGRDRLDDVLAELAALSGTPRRPAAPPRGCTRADTPDAEGWAAAVGAVLDGAAAGGARKVVLARRTVLTCDGQVEPLGLMRALGETAPHCFHFCFSPTGRSTFLGASPEQLFRREGRTVASEALAGTRPRGGDADTDAALAAELCASAKDGREHAFVDDHVRAVLDGLTEGLVADADVSVLKLATVQHLLRRLRGRLKPGFGDGALLAALHPTPAVCGEPGGAALAAIRALEPFDRGWYAGPVGFVGRDETRFAVGIRSALVEDEAVSLYTGAGVLEGSRPEAEWRELEAKLRGIWPGQPL